MSNLVKIFFFIPFIFFTYSCSTSFTNWSHKSGNNEKINSDLKDCNISAIKNISIPCTNPVDCVSQNLIQVATAFGKYSVHKEVCMINKGYSKDIYQQLLE